eukprot:scaffold100311_cov19-Tisochrysis_lutea.AAC.2
MEGGGRAGAGTPVNHRWSAHQGSHGAPPHAHATRGSLASSASASSTDNSPTTAAAAAAAASAMEWGVQGANSMDSAHGSCGGGAEEGGSRKPPFNLGGIASSAQHVAAAVLRAGAGALLQGPNAPGELGGSHTQGTLSSELARRTARSLSSSPDVLELDHTGEEHVQWANHNVGSTAGDGARGLGGAEEGRQGRGEMPSLGMGSAQVRARSFLGGSIWAAGFIGRARSMNGCVLPVVAAAYLALHGVHHASRLTRITRAGLRPETLADQLLVICTSLDSEKTKTCIMACIKVHVHCASKTHDTRRMKHIMRDVKHHSTIPLCVPQNTLKKGASKREGGMASARRAQLLVAYLEGEDNGKVQHEQNLESVLSSA